MDNLRGAFDSTEPADDNQDWDTGEEQDARDLPPDSIGQDERRMQVRAYNHWASLLGERNFPAIDSLEPENLPDFGPYSVVLDFSSGIDDPAVRFLGGLLAEECGAEGHISQLSDVPPRSLLSRITDHYMQILANQAPIGFEAEFVNQRGIAILYRGILLPFSSNDDTIDFIYGVINWKEMADQVTADELLLEIDQALESEEEIEAEADEPQKHAADALSEWADSPATEMSEAANAEAPEPEVLDLDVVAEEKEKSLLNLGEFASMASIGGPAGSADGYDDEDEDYGEEDSEDLPMPTFGDYGLDEPDEEDEEEDSSADYGFASLTDYIEAPTKKAKALEMDPDELESENAEMGSGEYNPADYDPSDFSPAEYNAGNDDAADYADDHAEPEHNEPANDLRPLNPVPAEPIVSDPEPVAEEAPVEEPAPKEPEITAPEPAAETPAPVVEEAPAVPAVSQPASLDEVADAISLADELPEDAGLYDCLASARELAETANASEDRSRQALYAAVGRAYDFSLAAKDAPEDYEELIAESGLTVQERAPMTPVVKLVFGSDYDKTRLTEYATVLTHAHRVGLKRGSLAGFLREAEGGLKGVVSTERRLRREEAGKPVEDAGQVRAELANKLRELEALTLEALGHEGPEFGLVMVRRNELGEVELLGEIEQDIPMIERAARKLVG